MVKKKHFKNSHYVYRVVVGLILTSLLYAIIVSIYQRNYITLFVSALTLILVLMPFFVSKLKVTIPMEIELIIVLFIYASIFLGEVHNFFFRFWWWDILLHGFSAIIFGFIGFTILYFMVNRHEINARPWALAVFSFSFAISIGVLWEIFEFSMDQFFGLNMQKSGLMDTMGDLIIDTLGALFASSMAFLYLKSRKMLIFNDLVEKVKFK